ncbi:hypothetical protein AB0F17_62055 [Nonomuraea sp. NPDC026600]|uniref:hypothetical protein n=1 Tax=Nonomuraea sp. NPDC026600 TaxID=3155363 RepID=UPI003403B3F4
MLAHGPIHLKRPAAMWLARKLRLLPAVDGVWIIGALMSGPPLLAAAVSLVLVCAALGVNE